MSKQKGFTLVELMVSIAIFTIVLGGVYSLYGFSNRSFNTVDANSDALNEARGFVERIEREIRQAKSPSAGTDAVVIPSGNQAVIATYVDSVFCYVAYRVVLDSGSLSVERAEYPIGGTASTWNTVLSNVSAISTTTSPPSDIDFFRVSNKSFIVSIKVNDSKSNMSSPIEIINTYTPRSKGAMS